MKGAFCSGAEAAAARQSGDNDDDARRARANELTGPSEKVALAPDARPFGHCLCGPALVAACRCGHEMILHVQTQPKRLEAELKLITNLQLIGLQFECLSVRPRTR